MAVQHLIEPFAVAEVANNGAPRDNGLPGPHARIRERRALASSSPVGRPARPKRTSLLPKGGPYPGEFPPHIFFPIRRARVAPGSFSLTENQGTGPERRTAHLFFLQQVAELRCHVLPRLI
jgi:hypothetical protein